nr:hypothetical protein [uncultured Desulfobacter sp.]
MPIIDRTIRLLLDHSDTIGRMMHDNFSNSALTHIGDRKLMVSQETIRMELEKIEETKPWLKSLQCRPDVIEIDLEGKRFGAAMGARLLLRIEKIIVKYEAQSIVLRVVEEATAGRNLWGKILCGVGSAILGSFMQHALEVGNLKRYADFDESNHLMTIRIGELDTVKRMLDPKIPGWPESAPLNFLGVDGAEHVEEGIIMNLVPSPLFEQWREKLRTAGQLLNRKKDVQPNEQTKNNIYERTRSVVSRVKKSKSDLREIGQTCRGVFRLGKSFHRAMCSSDSGKVNNHDDENKTISQSSGEKSRKTTSVETSEMSEGARFLMAMLGKPTAGTDLSNNLFLKKMLEQLGYDCDAIMDELETMGQRASCRLCATCRTQTLHMTSCCHRPICNPCFRKHRFSSDGSVYEPLGYTGHRKLGGSYDWKCPHCGHSAYVLDYDPDSDALSYARMNGYEPPVIVVRIDDPEKKTGWI